MIPFHPPAREYAGYIFDCDGTLADSMPLHLDAWNHGLEAAGAPLKLDGRSFMSVAGMAIEQTIEHWNRTHQLKIDARTVIEAKNRFYQERYPKIQPIEPVANFARSLGKRGASISVASGGTKEDVHETLRLIGLHEIFPVIVTACDVEFSKPAPDLFLKAAEEMGIAPEQCLVIEDSPLGIEAANLAGMESILLPNRLLEYAPPRED